MNPLFNRTLLCCLLLLTACSSQNQTTTGQNLPTGASVARHEADAKDISGEPALKKDELSAVGTVLSNKIIDSAVAAPAESKRANRLVMREMYAAPAAPMAVMPYMQQSSAIGVALFSMPAFAGPT